MKDFKNFLVEYFCSEDDNGAYVPKCVAAFKEEDADICADMLSKDSTGLTLADRIYSHVNSLVEAGSYSGLLLVRAKKIAAGNGGIWDLENIERYGEILS